MTHILTHITADGTNLWPCNIQGLDKDITELFWNETEWGKYFSKMISVRSCKCRCVFPEWYCARKYFHECYATQWQEYRSKFCKTESKENQKYLRDSSLWEISSVWPTSDQRTDSKLKWNEETDQTESSELSDPQRELTACSSLTRFLLI